MLQYRYKITIEYLGTGLLGWQRQRQGLSIQQILEEAIFQLTKLNISIAVAGRTDAGVHALGQVARFDLPVSYQPEKLMHSLNHFAKTFPVRIIDCCHVGDDFHARFSAKKRHYIYRVINRKGEPVIDAKLAWWIRAELNVIAMQQSGKYLQGHHDFTSFRATSCQAKSAIKTLSILDITIEDKEKINFHLSAPSFLHHMVRNIMGSLILVGLGKWEPEYIKTVLEAKDRSLAGATAPAHGLYLVRVDY